MRRSLASEPASRTTSSVSKQVFPSGAVIKGRCWLLLVLVRSRMSATTEGGGRGVSMRSAGHSPHSLASAAAALTPPLARVHTLRWRPRGPPMCKETIFVRGPHEHTWSSFLCAPNGDIRPIQWNTFGGHQLGRAPLPLPHRAGGSLSSLCDLFDAHCRAHLKRSFATATVCLSLHAHALSYSFPSSVGANYLRCTACNLKCR